MNVAPQHPPRVGGPSRLDTAPYRQTTVPAPREQRPTHLPARPEGTSHPPRGQRGTSTQPQQMSGPSTRPRGIGVRTRIMNARRFRSNRGYDQNYDPNYRSTGQESE